MARSVGHGQRVVPPVRLVLDTVLPVVPAVPLMPEPLVLPDMPVPEVLLPVLPIPVLLLSDPLVPRPAMADAPAVVPALP